MFHSLFAVKLGVRQIAMHAMEHRPIHVVSIASDWTEKASESLWGSMSLSVENLEFYSCYTHFSDRTAMDDWHVYLLRCSDGSLYCGVTTDLERRVREHNDGTGCRYTRSRRPIRLVWSAVRLTKSEAYKEEYRIKRLSKAAKEELVRREP